MNYQKHYDLLINRAKNRLLESDQYREKHHVIPRCIGGDDSPDNVVELTPEEHYVAHQLLVKIYPDHKGLVWAALQMTGHSNTNGRSNNKLYAWLRRKYQHVAKQRKGKKNGSYGRYWYHDPKTLHNVKCKPEEAPEGYVKGRKLVPDKPNTKCSVCGIDTGSIYRKYCNMHRLYSPINNNHTSRKKPKPNNNCIVCGISTGGKKAKYCKKHLFKIQSKNSQQHSDQVIIDALIKHGNIRQALLDVGIAAKGKNYVRAKRLIEEHDLPVKLKAGRPKKN